MARDLFVLCEMASEDLKASGGRQVALVGALVFVLLVVSVCGDTGPTAQFVTLNSGEYDNDSPVEAPRAATTEGRSGSSSGPGMGMSRRSFTSDCNRVPSGVVSEKTPGSGGFSIRISGSPKNFVPREGYTGKLADL